MTDRAGRPSLFFGRGDGGPGEAAGRQDQNYVEKFARGKGAPAGPDPGGAFFGRPKSGSPRRPALGMPAIHRSRPMIRTGPETEIKLMRFVNCWNSGSKVRKLQPGTKMAPEGVPGPSYEPAMGTG